MNNGRHHNGNGNGTATAARRNQNGRAPTQSTNGNGNGARAQRNPQAAADRNPTAPAPDALHWDAIAPRVTEALAQPLNPELVSQRKGAAAASSITSRVIPRLTRPTGSSDSGAGVTNWSAT